MSFADWHTGHDVGVGSQSSTFICMSTIEDFAHTPSFEEQNRDAAQKAATGRRSWKTVKGGTGEAVWSPQLEAALIEGLEKYQPDSAKNKCLGRFPMRNRFISDYIFQTTGKRRTPKQVGSRIQQLRDTCKGEHILRLISRTSGSPGPSSPPSIPDSDDSPCPSLPPTPPVHAEFSTTYTNHTAPHADGYNTQVTVNVTFAGSNSSGPPYVDLTYRDPQQITLPASAKTMHLANPLTPKSMTNLDPTVVVLSPVPLLDRYDILIIERRTGTLRHSETCRLHNPSHQQMGSCWAYQVVISRQYWKILTDYPDHFLVQHSLKPISSSIRTSQDSRSSYLTNEISISYQFESPQPVQPSALPGVGHAMYIHNASYAPVSSSSSMPVSADPLGLEPLSYSMSSSSGSSGHSYAEGQDSMKASGYPYYYYDNYL